MEIYFQQKFDHQRHNHGSIIPLLTAQAPPYRNKLEMHKHALKFQICVVLDVLALSH